MGAKSGGMGAGATGVGGGGAVSGACAKALAGINANAAPMQKDFATTGQRRVARTQSWWTAPTAPLIGPEGLAPLGIGEKNTPIRFVELMTMFLLKGCTGDPWAVRPPIEADVLPESASRTAT